MTLRILKCWKTLSLRSARLLFSLLLLPGVQSFETKPQWQVINEPMFSLIYELNNHSQAQRVAAQLSHYLRLHLSEMPVNRAIKPIPIVLFSRAHTSNGYVGLMPYRSHWYNKPTPFAQLEWYDALAVHEGRHIVQFNQMADNPMANALHFALGELGSGAFSALFLPSWFFEGDAVVSETLMTSGGRGRTASFDLWFRTDIVENQPYPYERAMLGTGFDRTPGYSPYVFGRYLTAYLRNQYGSDLFDRVINTLATPSGFNFNGAIKKQTGLGLSTHYEQMVQQLKGQWVSEQEQLNITPVEPLSRFQGSHWQSFYPISAVGERWFAVKVDAKLGASLVTIQESQVKPIRALSNRVARSYYSGAKTAAIVHHNDQWCWIEEKPHSKKPFQQTADLYCWNQSSGEQQLSFGDRFTYVGSNHQQFLLNRFNEDRSSEFVLLDKKGGLLKVVPLPINSIAYDIQPTEEGWIYILSGSKNDGIYRIDHNLEHNQLLIANQGETLRSPIQTQHWLLYISDQSGVDQVYAQSLHTHRTYQVATRPYGNYFLQWQRDKQRIVMADYTAQGQQIVSMEFTDNPRPAISWREVAKHSQPVPEFMEQLVQYKPWSAEQGDTAVYQSRSYQPLSHLWNPHSWSLFYNGNQIRASVSSDDVMDKLNLQVGAGYDAAADHWFGLINARYRSEAGPFYRAAIENSINESSQALTNVQFTIEQPIERHVGVHHWQWQPYVGLDWQQLSPQKSATRLLYGVNYQREKEKAFQAIATPSGFNQSLAGQFYLSEQTINWLSVSELTLEGLNERQSVDLSLSLQHLNYPMSMLSESLLFEPINELGYSAQMAAQYRVNLGAVGRSFTPLAYWRNTEADISLLSQQVDKNNDYAIGVGVSPNINLLRNSHINLKPRLSVYYKPNSDEVSLHAEISLGGF